MTGRKIQYWVIPPEADGEFVAHMEKVLDTYEQPYDSAQPVLGMDEQPVQLIKETRQPMAATAKHARRVDYEYERAGRASIFMFTEPLRGVARGDRAGVSNEARLGSGSGPFNRGPVPPVRENYLGLR
jgi:hypothetical protein